MQGKRVILAAMAATALGMLASVVPASAQYGGRYYDDGDEYRPRRYERRERSFDYDDDRPRFRRFGRGGGGSVCVTARGNCPYPPAPRLSSCSCEIPGFGTKRGAIDGY